MSSPPDSDLNPAPPAARERARFGESPLHALLWLLRVLTTSSQPTGEREPSHPRWSRLRDWLTRYGIAECGGVLGALVVSYAARRATGNAIVAAYAAAWGETIGYVCTIMVRDLASESRSSRVAHQPFRLGDALRVVADLATELGPAGALDSFVTRPLAMALATRALGLPLGVIAGKLAADLLFYVPVIIVYERRKQGRRRVANR
jgi:hypothetical protein